VRTADRAPTTDRRVESAWVGATGSTRSRRQFQAAPRARSGMPGSAPVVWPWAITTPPGTSVVM